MSDREWEKKSKFSAFEEAMREMERRMAEKVMRDLDEQILGKWRPCRLCGLEFSPADLKDGACGAHDGRQG